MWAPEAACCAHCGRENLCSCENRSPISRLSSLSSSHGSRSCLIHVVVDVVFVDDDDDDDKGSELYSVVYENVTLTVTVTREMGSSFPWLITFLILSIILV